MTRTRTRRPPPARTGGPTITPTTAERIDRLRELHLSGSSTAELRRHCREAWGLSDRQASRVLALLRERIAADWQATRPTLLPELLARAEHVYRQALDQGNLPVALGAIRTTARLAGLDGGGLSGPELVARIAEAIASAPIGSETRLTVQLSMASRGLLPLPDLSRLSTSELEAIAKGELLPMTH